MYAQNLKRGASVRIRSLGSEWILIIIGELIVDAWKDGMLIGEFEVSPVLREGRNIYLFRNGPRHMIYPESVELGEHIRCIACKKTHDWKDWVEKRCPTCGYDVLCRKEKP